MTAERLVLNVNKPNFDLRKYEIHSVHIIMVIRAENSFSNSYRESEKCCNLHCFITLTGVLMCTAEVRRGSLVSKLVRADCCLKSGPYRSRVWQLNRSAVIESESDLGFKEKLLLLCTVLELKAI